MEENFQHSFENGLIFLEAVDQRSSHFLSILAGPINYKIHQFNEFIAIFTEIVFIKIGFSLKMVGVSCSVAPMLKLHTFIH